MKDPVSRPPAQPAWMVLLKFGKREHLEAFRQSGLLYMSPQAHFSKLENDAVRTDPFEATDQIHQPDAVRQITIEGPIDDAGTMRKVVITPADMAGPLSVTLSTTRRYNVYCMYGLTRPLPGAIIDERNFEFGDAFVLVRNTQAFLDRVCAAVKAAGFGYEYRRVDYYDPATHSGDTGPFRKPSTFAYQNEFRIAVHPGLVEPLRIVVGSLEDVTTPVHSLQEINQLVDFSEQAAHLAGLGYSH